MAADSGTPAGRRVPQGGLDRGCTIWLTGLSGAGKSTITEVLAEELRRQGKRVEVLDGDEVRENLSKGMALAKDYRDTNVRRIGWVSDRLTRNGVFVIVAAISPYRAARDEVRRVIGDFIEVHVDCSLEVLTRRDLKGLYARARAGETRDFIDVANIFLSHMKRAVIALLGMDDPYEPPLHPDVRVDSAVMTVEESVAEIVAGIQAAGYLERNTTPPPVYLEHLTSGSHEEGADRQRELIPGPTPHGGVLQVRLTSLPMAAELAAEAQRLPWLELDAWALSDLELLAGGGLSPLTGFMDEADMLSVCERMRLRNGIVWSLPIILPVEPAKARNLGDGSRVALCSNGRPLAILTVSETYAYDRARVAAEIYGTSDLAHPGVSRALMQPGHAVAGAVDVFSMPEGSFPQYRLTPSETRAVFAEKGWQTVVAYQTRTPIHRAHEYLQKVALEQVDGLLLHPLVGETTIDDIPAAVRMRCYEAVLDHHYPRDRVVLSVFPASMRYAGPREAIFHALARKNYGCTHFIVGRDHAGVSDYYGSYAAQEIFDKFDPHEIGIQLLKFEHSFYCRACRGMATTRTCPHDVSERIILTSARVREMLRAGEPLPIEFTRPEIAEILRQAERAHPEAEPSAL